MEKLILRSAFKIRALSLLVLPLTLASCNSAKLEDVFGIDANTQVVGSFSQYDNAKIVGTGRVRFNSPLPQSSSRSFSLKASLDQISNSSVSAIFYSSDLTVPTNNGVVVTFTRNGLQVQVTVAVGNSVSTVNSSRLTYYYPASLDVIIDVHNVGSQARVLIWRRDVLGYTAANADVDTARNGDVSPALSVSTGGGGFVGLSLSNATVSAASISSQKILD